ncbi:MAG: helicase-related protein [Actinomycetia bacterium]|nr:helicase-related protein [Actinomycetes bacterium]
MRLEELQVGMRLSGVAPDQPVTVLELEQLQDAVMVTYRTQEGRLGEQLLLREAEERLTEVAGSTRPWTANGADFRLAAEAQRISLAGRFDPYLAISTSAVRPLPHQLRAVFSTMLPRSPLRFLLADDPGAGKTIMAGLLIKQLRLREDVLRCLVVAPGGLVEQWQDELESKFSLSFDLLTSDRFQAAGASVFQRYPLLIARMDQLARSEELKVALEHATWDLVVVDEAHRMGAHYYGNERKATKRFQLGEMLRDRTRHLLLMTATPHAGKEDDYQLFLSLLDPDTFEGRGQVAKADSSAFTLRRVKEELLTFEGHPLFPQREAQTVEFDLSDEEQHLYERVTDYVRTEMNRADALDGKRRTTVGFALTVLQRRLASSPEAILQSLVRRSARLLRRRDEVLSGRAEPEPADFDPDDVDTDTYTDAELEEVEESLVDSATSARTVAELDAELAALTELTHLARRLRRSGHDVKWQQLSQILQSQVLVSGERQHKLIIFTEHRDTLEYLRQRIGTLLGDPDRVVAIHGGVNRVERRRVTEEFSHNPQCQFLLATDAAGEGLNLQAAHLMVNYDLPWNPNRIEQRFGRVHRIGQEDDCRLWNLVARNTREGQVYAALFRKLEQMREAFGGKVFDVLGEVFQGHSLRSLLVSAIREGERPEVRERMEQVIDARVGDGIKELLDEWDLSHDRFLPADVEQMRLQMDQARARRLMPHYVEMAFRGALTRLGGRIARREAGRFEITFVPAVLRPPGSTIASRYLRVTFELDGIDAGPDQPRAELLAPGHPLLDEVMRVTLDRYGSALAEGAVLVSDQLTEPQLLLGVSEQVDDGAGEPVSRRFRYVYVDQSGQARDAGPAPHLDLVPAPPETAGLVAGWSWPQKAERAGLHWLLGHDLPGFVGELAPVREQEMDRLSAGVRSRLQFEMNRLGSLAAVAADEEREGKTPRRSSASLVAQATDLEQRLLRRTAQIARQRQLVAHRPRIQMAALVVPVSLLGAEGTRTKDTEAVELRAVAAVVRAEKALGRVPVVQEHWNPGFDILSQRSGDVPLRIEVKGRLAGSPDFEITHNEVQMGKNLMPDYRLALVTVDPDDPDRDQVRYIPDPFRGLEFGDFDAKAVVGRWATTWAKGREPW